MEYSSPVLQFRQSLEEDYTWVLMAECTRINTGSLIKAFVAWSLTDLLSFTQDGKEPQKISKRKPQFLLGASIAYIVSENKAILHYLRPYV